MKNERTYQESRSGPWKGSAASQSPVAVLALVIAALFAMGFRSSPAVAASGTSSQIDGAFSTIAGSCQSIQSTVAGPQASKGRNINSAEPVAGGARRYVAAWPRGVFHYFTTLENWPTLLDVRQVFGPEEPIGVGSEFQLLLGSGVEVDGVVSDWQEDRHFAAQLRADEFRSPILLTLSLEAVPDGSGVQVDAFGAPQGLMQMFALETISDGGTAPYLDLALSRIKAQVER